MRKDMEYEAVVFLKPGYWLEHPANYLFSLPTKNSGLKYPKNIRFNFENGCTGNKHLRWSAALAFQICIRTNAAFKQCCRFSRNTA